MADFKLSDVIGAGVIGDISEPKERGGFFGVYALGPMVRVEFAICTPRGCAMTRIADWTFNWTSDRWRAYWLAAGLEVKFLRALLGLAPNLRIHVMAELYSGLSVSHPLLVY
jgi:hypothetical protein